VAETVLGDTVLVGCCAGWINKKLDKTEAMKTLNKRPAKCLTSRGQLFWILTYDVFRKSAVQAAILDDVEPL
jgi:hypothetical protein